MVKLRLLAVIVIVILVFVGRSFWIFLGSPVDSQGLMRAFVITKGESVEQIAQKLEKERLIRSSLVFKLLLKASGQDKKIAAGDFKVSPAMSTDEIIKVLSQGSIDRWVTLIEGWRVEEMAEELSDELGVSSDEFIKAAKSDEGYLFPDTYLINPDAKVTDIIAIFKNNFNKKYDAALQKMVKSRGLTAKEGVILASIVEREARSDGARRQVASILLKRLKIGMGLNADATVQYALGYQTEEKSWWKRHLTNGDLKVNSPYNTYLHMGLPPTPICNPSLSALQAVANATETPYLYYYHDSQGNSYYATTLQEHNNNIAKHP